MISMCIPVALHSCKIRCEMLLNQLLCCPVVDLHVLIFMHAVLSAMASSKATSSRRLISVYSPPPPRPSPPSNNINWEYWDNWMYPPPSPPPPASRLAIKAMRLTGGPNTSSGRLEVYLSNGQWGTVCDDYWDSNPFNARVVCRQLGLPWTGAVAKSNAYFGSNTALPILVDDVACGGGETTLDACTRRTDGSNNCGHSEDVGE